ncbi:MAG: isocitrate lyase/phosphoenolpyruvate mutase family protein, partial [Proteobacteria bacterium]|nr:isocitrate lyase/phosphoenolpyruvate mutase family protein [Pseudomonadota bacterium]
MPTPFDERRARFRALHNQGCFLLPNPWDIGGARRLERLGFQAIASSSSACALSLGLEDYQISLEQALDH